MSNATPSEVQAQNILKPKINQSSLNTELLFWYHVVDDVTKFKKILLNSLPT